MGEDCLITPQNAAYIFCEMRVGATIMQIIVLASRKGGAGKTTIASHLAVEAGGAGDGPVALIDLDPMAGLSNWWNLREASTPYFAKVGKGGLPATLTELGKVGVKLVVIDTPPAVNAAIGAIIKAANIVLVPVIPSPNDLMAIGETLDIVFKMGRPLVFVVNNAGSGRLTGQAATVLSQHGTVSPVILRTRQDFRAAMIDGRTAVETVPKGKSAAEVAELWQYVKGRMELENARGAATAA
jgi:chromosome partitioning protein